MGKGYLIDTNVIIDLSHNAFNQKSKKFLSQIVDNESNISVINKIELLSFSVVKAELIFFIDNSNILMTDDEVVIKSIAIRKAHKIKLPDAIIATTALVNEITLITRNTSDFKNIKGLKVINPYNL